LACLCLVFALKVQSLGLIIPAAGAVGFFVFPITAIFTAYSAELSFPVVQGSATGYLFACSQTFGFVSGLAWSSIIDEDSEWKVYLFFGSNALFIFVSMLITWFTPEELNKTDF
jgi:sugar phosphate permease